MNSLVLFLEKVTNDALVPLVTFLREVTNGTKSLSQQDFIPDNNCCRKTMMPIRPTSSTGLMNGSRMKACFM